MREAFVKGLPDNIFLDFKGGLTMNQSIKTLDQVFTLCKLFISSDVTAPKIEALIAQCSRKYRSPVPAGAFVMGQTPTSNPTRECFKFIKGECNRENCRFLHSTPPPCV